MSNTGQISGAMERICFTAAFRRLFFSHKTLRNFASSVLKLLTLIACSAQLNPSDFIMRQVNEILLSSTFYYSGLNTVHVLRTERNWTTPLKLCSFAGLYLMFRFICSPRLSSTLGLEWLIKSNCIKAQVPLSLFVDLIMVWVLVSNYMLTFITIKLKWVTYLQVLQCAFE